ncbi:unnamed protein product [Diatraea saccharalis]|uniref:Uncharacterized protein n=1 Tax=Diatraea saccharalis TaxID=40085 RepID=A0A9N9WET1_9NEOP|nr:unnamed protein product [Diatraea saccharalis]
MNKEKIEVIHLAKLPKFTNVATNKMISALSAIALEMENDNEQLYEKLSLFVAKTIMSAKESETVSLHDDINTIRDECADYYIRNKLNAEMTENLKSENKALREKLEHLHKFINLGYVELQKMRNISLDNPTTVIQLKEIILSCGQYYADYCNEKETCLQIEQKNRFLNNKINILGTNIDGITTELKNIQYQNSKLHKENNMLKNKLVKIMENNALKIDEPCKNGLMDNLNNTFRTQSENNESSFDLSSHLSLVKNLLDDQDVMLDDLKKMSDELTSLPGLPML